MWKENFWLSSNFIDIHGFYELKLGLQSFCDMLNTTLATALALFSHHDTDLGYAQQSKHFWGAMKCLVFFNKGRNDEPRTTKSISVRSTSTSMSTDQDMRRSGSEFNSQIVSEFSTASSAKSFAILSKKQSNLREFTFSELKMATKNFSRSLMVGEGGFGGVYRGVIRSTDDPQKKIDVAIKQLSRRGLQASFLLFPYVLLAR